MLYLVYIVYHFNLGPDNSILVFKKILIYNSGGGIGDALQIIPLINALKLEFRNAEFHYLCAHENHFDLTYSLVHDLYRF